LDGWLEQGEQSGIVEFIRFAHRLRHDYAAVYAAFCYPWSQGPVEGHINRLKLLKRQMYDTVGELTAAPNFLQNQWSVGAMDSRLT
jgi:Transposase